MLNMGKMVSFMLALMLGVLPHASWSADDLMASQWVDQAREWQLKDRDDLAAELWRKLLRADPKHPEALVKLGVIEARAGNLREAQELYARAIRLPKPPAELRQLSAAIGPAADILGKKAILLPKSEQRPNKPEPTKAAFAKMNAPPALALEKKAHMPLVNALPKADVKVNPARKAEADTLYLKFSNSLEISP